jgi:N-acetyl-gamma-glutamyl-phosphate reductase
MKTEQLCALYEEAYQDCPFVRLREDPPNVNWVKNSNYADLGCYVDGKRAVLFCALDNLVKGGAGQAVQNMNLMAGLPETAGLEALPSNP